MRFTSLTIDVTQYLPYLLTRAKTLGAKVIKSRIPAEQGFAKALAFAADLTRHVRLEEMPLFVNATGLGARELVGDEKVFPTRGQTVLVKGEAHTIRTREMKDRINYVLPRRRTGMTVLGGTKDKRNW